MAAEFVNSRVNGLTILGDYMPSAETVSIKILVKTGSRDEAVGINGISHFLEHMAFKGTQKRTARQIAEAFDMIGGNFNAYTSREHTVYYAKVLKDDLAIALDILSDIVQHSLFDPAEIDRERKVILEELAQTRDTPDDHVFELFQEKLFQDQAIGRSILGTERFISGVTRDDLVAYINSRYGRNNVIVSCAGNFKEQELRALITSNFQWLPSHSNERVLDARYTGGEIRLQKDLEQVHLVIGFEGLSYLDEDFYSQQILSIILGVGMSSRLFQEVREKRGLAYHISTFVSAYQDTGVFAIYSATNALSANELINVAAAQCKLALDNITTIELDRAKAQVKASLLMAQESSSARAERIALNYAVFNRTIPLRELIHCINKITISDLQGVLSKILANKKLPTVAAIGKLDALMPFEQIQGAFCL